MSVRQFDAEQICNKLLHKHNLYQKGWRTVFSKSNQYTGRCWQDAKKIELSSIFMQVRPESDLEQTILHEIAHALVGPDKGHGPEWTNKALEIGVIDPSPRACGPAINLDDTKGIKPPDNKEEPKVKRQFHRINANCPICQKQAEEHSYITLSGTKWTKLKCGHLVKHEQLTSKSVDIDNWTSATGKIIFPYQVDGIKFIEQSGGRALIADEPGLGKTIQALGFIFAHYETVTPALWVCKSTLKLQALKEIIDWCGPAFMAQIIDSPKAFIIPNLKIYIISMDLLRNMPTDKLEKMGFKTVVADEIQHFKNPDSTRTAELRKLVSRAEYFLPLSGTPWKNRGQEYFPVLNMLDPVRFPSYENFKNIWVDTYIDPISYKQKQGGIRNIPRFREYTKDLVIRRLRDDVLPDLPKIMRQIRFIDMEGMYKIAYDEAEGRYADKLKAALIDGTDLKNAQGDIMALKHITGLAKVGVAIEDTVEWLENSPSETDKMTIFHHHIDVGDHIQNGDGHQFEGLNQWLVKNGFNKCLRLFGGRSPEERDDIITKFKMDAKNRILIGSTLASGEGLNIQFCQNAMQVERQWNPANEEQAEFRFSRPLTWGDYPKYLQELLFHVETKLPKHVSIRMPYLIADNTVDNVLVPIVERKRVNFNKSMNEGQENLTYEDNDIIKAMNDYILKKRFGRK